MTGSDVCVVIVNWNSGDLLSACLDAVHRQTLRPRRVLVVDNASGDGSAQRAMHGREDVELLTLDRNTGFAAANNLAVRQCEDGRWVALLNPDAFPEPTWLERLMEAAKAHPDFSFFASRLVSAGDPGVLDGAGDAYAVNGLAWRRDHGRPATAAALESAEVFSPCAAAALYRRDVFLDAGGFDESFFCYFEDVDLAFRMRLLGHRCLYVAPAVARHLGSALTGRRSDFSVYHGHRNLVWTFVKNMPLPMLLLYLPQHLLLNLVSLAFYSRRGQGCVLARAKWDALRGLPRIWRERRTIQSRRRAGIGALRGAMIKGLLAPYLDR